MPDVSNISATRLARELSARLSPVPPPPFRVSAVGAELRIDHPDGWGTIMPLEWLEDPSDDRGVAELAELAVRNALDSLQDAVSEAGGEPWPPLSPDAPRAMAPCDARCDGTAVRFWYGRSEESPVIAFRPILLRDVVHETVRDDLAATRRPSLTNVYLVTAAAAVFPVLYALLGAEPSPAVETFGLFAPVVAVVLWFQRYLRREPIARIHDAGWLFWLGWPVLIPFYAVRLEGRRGWGLAAITIALIFAPELLAAIAARIGGS
jgi:hypothetical protein